MSIDIARAERFLEEIDRTIEHNRATLREVARKREESDREYAILNAKIEKARRELRKLGLLKAE